MVDLPRKKAHWLAPHTPSLSHALAMRSFLVLIPTVTFFRASWSLRGRCFSMASTPVSLGIMYTISVHHSDARR
jgi:hypothetical protein